MASGLPPGNGGPSLSVFTTNLVNACKLAVFRTVLADQIVVAWWQIAAFGLISLLLPFVYDLHSEGISGHIAWDTVPAALVHLPILMLASIVAAYSLDRSDATLSL
ncbi:MAG TPA: hypothetical protein VEG60_12710, partial [Candidatus Binatia bacterium]|nr:hypothetical protein [Candidatus Binatia bacterium]